MGLGRAVTIALAALAACGRAGDEEGGGEGQGAEVTALPQAASAMAAARVGQHLYVLGGHIGAPHDQSTATFLRSFQRLDLAVTEPRWEPLATDEHVQQASLFAHGGELYRIGGLSARNPPDEVPVLSSLTAAAVYDPLAGDWRGLPPLPVSRASQEVVVEGGVAHVIGGWTLDDGPPVYRDTVESLDLAAPGGWRSTPQPFLRRDFCAGALGGRIYVMGGMDETNALSNDTWIYDVAGGEWTMGPPLPDGPLAGFGCAAAVADGALIYSGFGGALHRLDGDSWVEVASLAEPRAFHRLVAAAGGELLAIGGVVDAEATEATATIEVIELDPR